MTRNGRRATLAVAILVALLFAGRWAAGFLAERWWGAHLGPGIAAFLSDRRLFELVLDVGGVLVASAWFVGNLLVVYRAIGAVQVPRHVGNVEFRETVTPRVLLGATLLLGVALGLLVGGGASAAWAEISLAWHGVTYGVREPLLGHDIGLYVAQLPLWRRAQSAALLLVALGVGATLSLYVTVGAVRWMDGRPAINDHARRHLGWLLATLALVVAAGFALGPFELVGGRDGPVDARSLQVATLLAPALVGTGFMVAVVSALWALRPRHALLVAGWLVLVLAGIAGELVLPAIVRERTAPAGSEEARRRFTALAYGLGELREREAVPDTAAMRGPEIASLWDRDLVTRIAARDTTAPVAVSPAVLAAPGARRPVWLAVRTTSAGGLATLAVADDRVTSTGGPLFYRGGDPTPYPTPHTILDLSEHALRPGATDVDLDAGPRGVPAGTWLRRLALAWHLQDPRLLADGERPRVGWRRDPVARLERIAPFAEWDSAAARIVNDRLLWLADGYVTAGDFPLARRSQWRDREVGAVRAAFLGVVDAESGETHVYLREDADPLALAWADVGAGVVEDAAAAPAEVLRAAAYPAELFRVQAAVLEGAPWVSGSLVGGARREGGAAAPTLAWIGESDSPVWVAAYQRGDELQVAAVLLGVPGGARATPELLRLDTEQSLPAPTLLETRWDRFPLFEQLRDSVRANGGHVEAGRVRYWLGSRGLGAYQPAFGVRPGGRPALVWVSVAWRSRLGAGRGVDDAWQNLQGASVPVPPGRGRLEEARRWMRLADSALRHGDWAGFGHAFESLRDVLQASESTAHDARDTLAPPEGRD